MYDVHRRAVESRPEMDVESAEAAFGGGQRAVPIIAVIHHAAHYLPVILRRGPGEGAEIEERSERTPSKVDKWGGGGEMGGGRQINPLNALKELLSVL